MAKAAAAVENRHRYLRRAIGWCYHHIVVRIPLGDLPGMEEYVERRFVQRSWDGDIAAPGSQRLIRRNCARQRGLVDVRKERPLGRGDLLWRRGVRPGARRAIGAHEAQGLRRLQP